MPAMKDDPGAAFAALKQPAVDALARILYMKHATTRSKTLASCDTWLKLQRFHIAALHEASIRRQGTLSLMADVFIRGAFSRPHEVLQAQGTAALCRSHRALNPHVLSALMALVTEEATVRADRVRARLQEQKETKQPQQREDVGEEAAERWLRSMSSITVLWMGKTRWEDEMQRALDVSVPQCARHHDCAACKLAVVGGSKQFLMDLRTSLLARRHLHLHDVEGKRTAAAAAPQPPLLRMAEAWIDRCYDARRQRHIRDESDLMVGIVAKLLGAQMSAGGAAESRREEGRGHMRRGWRMPMMELKEGAYVLGGASGRQENDVDNDDEYAEEDGWIAGRWRPRRRTGPREGYSQYLPNSLIIRRVDSIETARATIDSSRAAENAPSASAYRPPVCVSENSNDEDAHGRLDDQSDVRPPRPTTDDHCPPAPPCRPLQPMPPSHRRRSTRLGVDVAAEAGASLNVPDSAGARSSSTTLHSPSSLFTQNKSSEFEQKSDDLMILCEGALY
ncbi:uncharacterized protein LMH87_008985 [Akanthomyces muscarius]|uniref:Uncharacterized protein n=1 Tax=Akanthomyces muscarius TaxID=2231603 RepID=A0A9W8QHE2_AKAMU|nr:uncharacterized protein LMH87_008985 [Akanthomyces muscarius]KAJ4158461.1 hypothetical protein LMH87_008985 [Akanthomyces muscarius]